MSDCDIDVRPVIEILKPEVIICTIDYYLHIKKDKEILTYFVQSGRIYVDYTLLSPTEFANKLKETHPHFCK